MVSDGKTFAHKGCKIAAHQKFVFWRILPYYQDFFGIGASICIDREMFCLTYSGFLNHPVDIPPLWNDSALFQCQLLSVPAFFYWFSAVPQVL